MNTTKQWILPKDNGTTETTEELENLRQILEGKKSDVMKIGEEWDILMEKLKSLQESSNEEILKVEKEVETIQLIYKDLESAKSARIPAENSTCFHSDIFEINKDKSKVNGSVLVDQLIENCLL